MKGSSPWLPSSQTRRSPPPYPVQKTESVRKNRPETFDFGQSLNDKRGQETAAKLLPPLKPKYIPLAGSFQTQALFQLHRPLDSANGQCLMH